MNLPTGLSQPPTVMPEAQGGPKHPKQHSLKTNEIRKRAVPPSGPSEELGEGREENKA